MDFHQQRSLWSELRRIAARYTRSGSSDAADDLAQDLALAAVEDGGRAQRPGAWLERVGRNAAVDRWRVERRRGELLSENAPAGGGATVDPEAQLLARERRRAVRNQVAALPRLQRRVTVLRFHSELPLEAVAARLGTPAATARTRLHRALASLRRQLHGLRASLVLGWPTLQTAALSLAVAVATTAPVPAPTAPLSPGPAPTLASAAPARHGSPARPSVTPPAPLMLADARSVTLPRANPPRPSRPTPLPVMATPPVQVFTYDNDAIEVGRAAPDEEVWPMTVPARHPSLIELRADLIPELTKSLDDI